MNPFIERKMHEFREYYDTKTPEEQISMVKRGTQGDIFNILTPLHGREYCEILAMYLVEKDFQGKIGNETYKTLVEQIEAFFKHELNRQKPTWVRNLLCFLQKKSRQCERCGTFEA